MSLQIQIFSLIFSFLFGLVFAFFVNLHYDMLFSKNKWFRLFINFIFVIDMALLYFLILKSLNGGVLHLYFFLLIFLGFLLSYVNTKKVRKCLRKFRQKK